VYDAELLRTWTIRDSTEAWRRTLLEVHRLVSESTPHALKLAGIGIKHGHAVVAVAVGDEQFIRLAAVTNLHYELSGLRELQQLVTPNRIEAGQVSRGTIASADPHEAFVVDKNSVLPLRPFR